MFMFRKSSGLGRLLVCLVIYAAVSFTAPVAAAGVSPVKLVTVITANEFSGKLNQPMGLFFDENKKRLYVADSGSKRIISYDQDFKYLAELTNDDIQLPTNIVRNGNGQFLVVDASRAEILFFEVKKDLQIDRLVLKGVPEGKEIFVPGRIAIDKKDNVYIVDKLNRRIIVVDRAGIFLRALTVKGEGFFGFNDVRADGEGNVFALDTLGGKVYGFDRHGNLLNSFGGKDPAGRPYFEFPVSLAVTESYIYVADGHLGTIRVFDKTGNLRHSISKKGEREGELSSPVFVFTDDAQRIFVIDGNRVQVLKEEK